MKGWMRYLLWEGIPFLLLFFVLGLLSLLNWDYESKLLSLDNNSQVWSGVYLGPLILLSAMGLAGLGSLLLYSARFFKPNPGMNWVLALHVAFVIIVLILPSLFLAVFGPASIFMFEQMQVMPR